jgi:hypothetical protein
MAESVTSLNNSLCWYPADTTTDCSPRASDQDDSARPTGATGQSVGVVGKAERAIRAVRPLYVGAKNPRSILFETATTRV